MAQIPSLQLAGVTVLVVDDEPVLNLTMSLLLERAGAAVLRAENGAAAFQHLLAGAVDVMVCDQNMPVMDGSTLLKKLHAAGRSVPTLLFVSGMLDENSGVLQAMGVRRLLSKPVQPAELIDLVTAVLAELPAR